MGILQIIIQIITWSLSTIVFAFIYNKMYVKYLVGEGFKVKEISSTKDKEAIYLEIGIEPEEVVAG